MLKKILYFFTFLTIFLFATPINNPNIYPRIALVIGNSDYPEWGDLDGNPIKDATDMKKLLKSRGFDVLYKINAKQKEFEKLLIEFRNRLRQNQNSIGLFYFSGHGMEIEGTNYLIPVDSQSPARYDNIELNKIIDDMGSSNNQLNIIILDACRDNPFILTRSFNKGGFAKIVAPEGLFISYATKAGRFAQNGKRGENGLFTKYLLYYMQQPLKLYEVFKETRKAVFNASAKEQLPTVYDQTIGDDFYFTMPKTSQTDTIRDIKKIKISPKMTLFDEISIVVDNLSTLHLVFIVMGGVGLLAIFITTLTWFLYSERTDYILKSIAIFLTFWGSSGYIMSRYLKISDELSLLIPCILSIVTIFFIPKPKKRSNQKIATESISLVGHRVVSLEDIPANSSGLVKSIKPYPKYQRLVKNISSIDYTKGDILVIIKDGNIPIVEKKDI